ncbi:alpha-2-macroglobulin family protein [Acidiphilium iwatense]|uniref:MG2 domain-containing protein n=1 Tax=Acidiphilium iwatense TaxID=768198 RepID=A0ABS9DSY3_9PROT|nr:MG2 domain-containing protein [Acidiphilium iwatense]MCF3945844.1 MG2 domain-containing protein [Acidiphilium iwatense]
MRNHRRIGVLLAWLLCFVVASVALSQTARAGGSAPPSTVFLRHLLPGLGENARQFQAFGNQPTAGNSAGLAARRADLTRQAKQAYDDQDWPNASSLYRKRLRLGDENHPSLWLALATASSRRKTADARTVETAAFIAYELNETHGADATTAKRALLLIAKGLRLQNNNLARIDLLAAMRRAYPDDDLIKHELAEASKTFGIRVRKLTVHANRFPTSACIAFNVKLGSAPDFHPADWVIFTPPVKGAAITEQNGDLCIDGLPAGHTTRVILRAGLPLQAGTTLPSETKIPVAIRDRRAQLIADVGHYLIPASSPSTIGISTVNLDKVRLKIVRIAERSLTGFFSNHPLFNPTEYQSSLGDNYGKTIWKGEAKIQNFVSNRLIHSVIALPDVMKKTGLYAIAIRPGPGLPDAYALNTVQLVLRTNMAPIVWRGWNGMNVQIRKFTSAQPYADVTVNLIAADNAILASAKTNGKGIVSFAGPLLAGIAGQSPAALHITGPDGDFTVFNLTGSPLDLSDRGISGRPVPNRIDPYLWLDRGIYRPGETVHVAALYRTDRDTPLDLPLHVIIRRPAGQVYLDRVAPRTDDDSIALPVKLPGAAQAGNWSVSLALGAHKPALARRQFTVAAFVPAKLKVSLGRSHPLTPGKIDHWPLNVRFLYGAPGSKLTGNATLRLIADNQPFPQWRGYSFGLQNEIFQSKLTRIALPETGPRGNTSVPIDLTSPPDTTRAIEAKLSVSINDPSGRAVTSAITLPITPARPLIGIKENFAGQTVGNKIAPGFNIVAIGPAGSQVKMAVTISLVRQETEWHIYFNGSAARWAITHIDRPVETRTITLAADKPTVFTAPVLGWGRYRLRVVQAKGGFAASSVIFYSGFATSANPAVPQRVTVSSDHQDYAPGDTAELHVTAPFHGPATLVIANNAVLSMRNFTLPNGGTTLDVPVKRAWGPGAYAIVEAFQKPDATSQPSRAVGLTWLAVKPGRRKIDVSIPTKKLYRPGHDITVDVHARPGAYVTLAAVDEGILQLTDFPNPDPIGHFFGKWRLGVGVMDDYAALLLPPSGQAALLKNGAGANFGPAVKPIPQRIVSLFAGPVRAGSDGVAKITLHIPEFNGQIRLMAVAWTKTAVGAAHTDIIVRDRVIANALLPRFLAPGDIANAGLMLQNLDLPDGQFTATVAATGPLAFKGRTSTTLDLKPGTRHVVPFQLAASNAEGTGQISLDLTGPNYALKRHWTLTVHSARAPVTRLAAASIKPGATQQIGLNESGLYPGSVQSTVTFGNTLPFDPAEYMQALAANTLPFLAQSVSRGLPLTVLRGPVAGPDPTGRLARAVEQVLDLQRFDGSFGLWSSHDFSEPWLTAYATEFLLRARKAGVYVPGVQIDQALAWLHNEVVQGNHGRFSQIYATYVLGLAGRPPAGAIRLLGQDVDALHMPLARAQLGAALNDIGEPNHARAALNAALAIHNRLTGDWWFLDRDWQNAFGSPLRDAWAVPAVIAQTGLLRDKIPELRANLPGKGISVDDLNAQELAWACFANGILGAPPPPMDFRIGTREMKSAKAISQKLTSPVSIDNLAATPLAVSVATTGIPAKPPAAARQGMIVDRRFYTMSGDKLDPSNLAQNTVFIMVISGRSVDSAPHRAVVDAGLPAGWELAGNISSGKVSHMRWLGTLSHPRIRAAADDRYEAAFDLAPHESNFFGEDNGVDREFRVAVMLRAVTPGRFTLPGVTLSDMFHPMVYGRTEGGSVAVLAPGQIPPKPNAPTNGGQTHP